MSISSEDTGFILLFLFTAVVYWSLLTIKYFLGKPVDEKDRLKTAIFVVLSYILPVIVILIYCGLGQSL